MDKFEYGRLYHSEKLFDTESWMFNNHPLKDEGYKYYYHLYEVLDYLGKKGWEMLFKDGNEYVFKRKL